MEREKLQVIVALEAIAIAVLGIITVSMLPQLIASAGSDTSTIDGFPHNGQMIHEGTYTVVKELIVKNTNGSVDFLVDEHWNAIWIEVQGIDNAIASWSVTPPDFPSGAPVVNGTALPFMESSQVSVQPGAFAGQLSPLYNATTGNWTLRYDIQNGSAKIYIIQAELKNL